MLSSCWHAQAFAADSDLGCDSAPYLHHLRLDSKREMNGARTASRLRPSPFSLQKEVPTSTQHRKTAKN